MNPAVLPPQLTLGRIPPLLAALDSLSTAEALDLSGVEQIDSAGISLLLEATRRAKARGRRLPLRGASERVRTLTTFLGVDALLGFEKEHPRAQ